MKDASERMARKLFDIAVANEDINRRLRGITGVVDDIESEARREALESVTQKVGDLQLCGNKNAVGWHDALARALQEIALLAKPAGGGE